MYTSTHCKYTFEGLERTITPAFDSVSLDSIRKYFQKTRDYIHAYRDGHSGLEAEVAVKVYKSHRKVSQMEAGSS